MYFMADGEGGEGFDPFTPTNIWIACGILLIIMMIAGWFKGKSERDK